MRVGRRHARERVAHEVALLFVFLKTSEAKKTKVGKHYIGKKIAKKGKKNVCRRKKSGERRKN